MKLAQYVIFLITLLSSSVLFAQKKVSKAYLDHNRKVEQAAYKEHVERVTQYIDSLNLAKSLILKHRNALVHEFLAKKALNEQNSHNREFELERFLKKNSEKKVRFLSEKSINSSIAIENMLTGQQNLLSENLSYKKTESYSFTNLHEQKLEQFFKESSAREDITLVRDNQKLQHDFLKKKAAISIGSKKTFGVPKPKLEKDDLAYLKETEKSPKQPEQNDLPISQISPKKVSVKINTQKDASSIQADFSENKRTKLILDDSLSLNESSVELQNVSEETSAQQYFTADEIEKTKPKTPKEEVSSAPKMNTLIQPTDRLIEENSNTSNTYFLQFSVLTESKNPSDVAHYLGLPTNLNLIIKPKGELFAYVTEALSSFEEANTKASEIHNRFGVDIVVVDDKLNNIKYYTQKVDNIDNSTKTQNIYLQIAFLQKKISLDEFQRRQRWVKSQEVTIIRVSNGYKYVLGPFQDKATARKKQSELKALGVESFYYIHH